MQLYDSIFKRKSTRKYLPEALAAETLSQILDFVGNARPLYPQIRTRIELANTSDVKGLVSAKAPHYLLLYAEKTDGYLPNTGFLLQQVDLYLSALGLGSCWLGMANATVPAKEGLDFVIMLAFGKAQDHPHRTDVSAFNRNPLSKISSGNDKRLEAVRLAPSASNSQPWYFTCNEAGIYVYRKNLGMIKSVMYNTMNQIDMGIALCHLWLASEHAGHSFVFEPDEQGSAPQVSGYTCMGRVR